MPELSEVLRTIQEYRQKLALREAKQMVAMLRHWRAVEDALKSEIDKLSELPEMKGWQASQLERYQSLLRQVERATGPYRAYAMGSISEEMMTYGKLGLQYGVDSLRIMTAARFDYLPTRAVEYIVQQAPLNRLISRISTVSATQMMSKLATATAIGLNPRTTAKLLKDGLRGGLQRSLVIARDQELKAYREATREQYIESNVCQGYKRLASRSSNTCLVCLIEDGKQYDLDREFIEHVCGRCALVPITEDTQVSWQLGSERFQEFPEEKQQAMMGKTRWAAWQAGDVNLADMVKVETSPEWGQSLALRGV